MLGYKILELGTMRNGRYKVYIWGQPDGHISDWRGCNYRFKPIPNQPKLGFETPTEAVENIKNVFKTQKEFETWFSRCGDGQFLSEDKFIELDFKDISNDLVWPQETK